MIFPVIIFPCVIMWDLTNSMIAILKNPVNIVFTGKIMTANFMTAKIMTAIIMNCKQYEL